MAVQQTNTTCDVYHTPNAPPAAPDVAGVKGYLAPDFAAAHAAAVASGSVARWTHVLLLPPTTDVRDGYGTAAAPGQEGTAAVQDSVYVPDQNGTKFWVVFVERLGLGTALDCKRVYLQRQAPNWSAGGF